MNPALFVSWRSGDETNGHWGPVGRLEYVRDSKIYRFRYTNGARTLPGFRPLIGMTDLDIVYDSDELFPVFTSRLMAKSRPEYAAYLSWSGFDPITPPDPITLLAVTEGRRETDQLEVFPCPMPDAEGLYHNKFFVHGVRWMGREAIKGIEGLAAGEPLGLMPDFSNPYDRNAVALRTMHREGRFLVGYVPRYLAADARTLIQNCDPDWLTVTVERVNRDAPMQNRLLCTMRACWPENFRPCSGDQYQPISNTLKVAAE
jgi:hypothetical protein